MYDMQGADDAVRMGNQTVSGAMNTVSRIASEAANAFGQEARNVVSSATDAVGNLTGINYNTSGHRGSFEYGNNGRSSYDYAPPRYSEVPERDYSDKRLNNSFSSREEVEMNSNSRVTKGGFGSIDKKSRKEITFNDINDERQNSYENRNQNGYYQDSRCQEGGFSSRKYDSGRRYGDDRSPQNGPSKGRYLYPDLPNDESDSSEISDDRWKGRKQNISATHNEKMDQLIDLINQMPGRRERRREDETQMQTKQSRERGGLLRSKWEMSNNRESMESRSSQSFRKNRAMNESSRRKINWPKLGKKKTQAELQELAVKKVCCTELEMVPCMVPRVCCDGGEGCSYCRPTKCNSDKTSTGGECCLKKFCKNKCFVPKCVIVPCGELECCGGANDASRVDPGFSRNSRDGSNRQRSFSLGGLNGEMIGSCQCRIGENTFRGYGSEVASGTCCCKPRTRCYSGYGDLDTGYNRGINGGFGGGMNSDSNGGISSGFKPAINGCYNMGMNNGFSNGIPSSFNNSGMSCGMGGVMNMSGAPNILDSNSLAALNGICTSLNAINGALGGLAENLNNMNGNSATGVGGNMEINCGSNLGMNMPSGANMGVSIGKGMSLGLGGSFEVDQPISTGTDFGIMNSNAQIYTGAQKVKFSGSDGSIADSKKPLVQYARGQTMLGDNNQSSSILASGFPGSISLCLNTVGVDEREYEIQYIEPDMEEYNRKVKEAQEKAEQKRQELIRQRDAEVARKRAEVERQIEEEYKRRKAEAERQREAEIKARISQAQCDLEKKEQDLMQTFTQKLKAVRDAETDRRRRYEIELAEANQRSQQLQQKLVVAQRQVQEIEACKVYIQQQEAERKCQLDLITQQIQSVTNVPSYESDNTEEKKLLAEFCQQMCLIKSQEQKIREEAANVPLPYVEKPEIPEIPIPEIPEVIPESVPIPERKEIRVPKPKPICPQIPLPTAPSPPTCQEVLPLYQCLQPQPQSYCMPAIPMMPITPVPLLMPSGCYMPCSSCCMQGGGCGSGCCSAVGDGGCCDPSACCKTSSGCILSKCCKQDGMLECCPKPALRCCDTSDNCKSLKCCKPKNTSSCCESSGVCGSGRCDPPKCCKPTGCCLSLTCKSACCTKDNCSNDKDCDDAPKCEEKKKCEKKKKCEEKTAKRSQPSTLKKREENTGMKDSPNVRIK